MVKQSIRRRMVAIAVGLIVLMVATSVLSMVMVGRVDELTARYSPANAHLTQINVLSLERALALRRMLIAKMQDPPDVIGYRVQKQLYDAKDVEIDNYA